MFSDHLIPTKSISEYNCRYLFIPENLYRLYVINSKLSSQCSFNVLRLKIYLLVFHIIYILKMVSGIRICTNIHLHAHAQTDTNANTVGRAHGSTYNQTHTRIRKYT